MGKAVDRKVYEIVREREHEKGPVPKPIRYEVKEKGCWECLDVALTKGIPYLWHNGKNVAARRWFYAQKHGKLPANVRLMAKCDQPWCVNPDHMEAREVGDVER